MGLAEQDWSRPERPCPMTSHKYVSLFQPRSQGSILSRPLVAKTREGKKGKLSLWQNVSVRAQEDQEFATSFIISGWQARGIWKCQQHPKAVWHNARESNTKNKVGIHSVYHGPAEELPEYRPLPSGKLTFPEERRVLYTATEAKNNQEPLTWSKQLPCTHVKAFSRPSLFLEQ